jgi:hypothetical protein
MQVLVVWEPSEKRIVVWKIKLYFSQKNIFRLVTIILKTNMILFLIFLKTNHILFNFSKTNYVLFNFF